MAIRTWRNTVLRRLSTHFAVVVDLFTVRVFTRASWQMASRTLFDSCGTKIYAQLWRILIWSPQINGLKDRIESRRRAHDSCCGQCEHENVMKSSYVHHMWVSVWWRRGSSSISTLATLEVMGVMFSATAENSHRHRSGEATKRVNVISFKWLQIMECDPRIARSAHWKSLHERISIEYTCSRIECMQ